MSAVFLVLYVAAPGGARPVVAVIGGLFVLSALVVGLRINPWAEPTAWRLLSAAVGLSVIGNALSIVVAPGHEQPPALALIFFVPAYALGLAGITLLAWRRMGGAIGGVLDASVGGLTLGLLAWVVVIRPEAVANGATGREALVAALYPTFDALILTAMLRVLAVGRRGSFAFRGLVASLVALFLGDLLFSYASLDGADGGGVWAQAFGLVFAFLWVAAALHPSIRQLAAELDRPKPPTTLWSPFMAGALIVATVVGVIARLDDGDTLGISAWCAGVALLVFVRMALLLRDHRRALDALQLYEDAIRSTNVGLYVFQLEKELAPASLRVIAANPASTAALGIEEKDAVGCLVGELFPDLGESEIATFLMVVALRGAARDLGELQLRGRILHASAFPLPNRCVGVSFTNVTEQRELEGQLRQSQKMEAVGQLAGGVAHDFNNLLLVIRGYGELALGRVNGGDPALRGDLEEIDRAAVRATALTQQLLAFSRRQVLKPEVLDVNELVRETERLLARLIGAEVEFETLLSRDEPLVEADPGQIQQVILNLALNARDAMPHGGRLRIETGLCERDGSDYAFLSVADDGEGIPETIRHRIFEPFYTTKELGRGTGLGLSTAYGIVQQSGGTMEVESEEGRGSCFTVYLPASSVPYVAESASDALGPACGRETVLIVEDETTVRTLLVEALEAQGYDVLSAGDPLEAVDRITAHTGPLDLVLTDLVMPNMNGSDLADRVDELRPGTRIIFMSGYSSERVATNGELPPGRRFLQKPFALHELAVAVRGALDARAVV